MIDVIPAPVRTVALLAPSNVFMTFAWYGHLWAGLCLVGAVYFVFRSA